MQRRSIKIALRMFVLVVDHSGVSGADLVARTSLGGSGRERLSIALGLFTSFPEYDGRSFGEALHIRSIMEETDRKGERNGIRVCANSIDLSFLHGRKSITT